MDLSRIVAGQRFSPRPQRGRKRIDEAHLLGGAHQGDRTGLRDDPAAGGVNGQRWVPRRRLAHQKGAPRTCDGIPLGNWVARQRREYAKGTLDRNWQRTLEQLPTWSWDPYGDEWKRRFDLLKQYVAEHGDARVPAPYKTADGVPLGSWVRDQRDNYRKGTLKADRARKLMKLPHWTWGAPPKGPRRGSRGSSTRLGSYQ